MNKPLVSVIVPVYNVEQYIKGCAQSLFEQTLNSVEYIFIDDCSPDNSITLVKDVLKQYPNRKDSVIFYRMPQNSGLPMVRKRGIELSSGEYIIHCDSDDTIETNMLEVMYNTAKQGNYDLVTCEIDWSNGYQMPFVECGNKLALLKATLEGKVIESVCTKMVKKAIYEEDGFIYTKDNINEDCVFSTQIIFYSKSFKQLPNKFYHYYMRPNSLSHGVEAEKMMRNFNQFKRNIGLIEDFLQSVGLKSQVRNELDMKKLACKNYIIPLTGLPKYKKIWTSTYPEISGIILLNKSLSLRSKLVYYSVKFNLYKYLRPIFTKQHD